MSLPYYIFWPLYQAEARKKLAGMIYRCEKSNDPGYKYYGAKGVKVCSEWRDDPETFVYWCWENNFFLHCHIHRLNPHKDYEVSNCILCSAKEHWEYHSEIATSKRETTAALEWAELMSIIGKR